MKQKIFKTSFSLGMLIFGLFAFNVYAKDTVWTIKNIAANGPRNPYEDSFVVDTLGNIQMVYIDQPGSDDPGDLKYASYNSSTNKWEVATIRKSGYFFKPSFAVDNLGKPGVVYSEYSNNTYNILKYSSKNGSEWTTETVESQNSTSPSLAFDSNNNPKIAYSYNSSDSPDSLRCADYHDGAWHITTVDQHVDWNFNGTLDDAFLAIDKDNGLHISYYDAKNEDLKYATYAIGTWNVETVDSTGDVGRKPFLVMDMSNTPRISYYDRTNKMIKYASSNEGVWNITNVGVSHMTFFPSVLALDSNGNPKISYYDYQGIETPGSLKYATYENGTWTNEIIDQGFPVTTSFLLSIDQSNNSKMYYWSNYYIDEKYSYECKYASPASGQEKTMLSNFNAGKSSKLKSFVKNINFKLKDANIRFLKVPQKVQKYYIKLKKKTAYPPQLSNPKSKALKKYWKFNSNLGDYTGKKYKVKMYFSYTPKEYKQLQKKVKSFNEKKLKLKYYDTATKSWQLVTFNSQWKKAKIKQDTEHHVFVLTVNSFPPQKEILFTLMIE